MALNESITRNLTALLEKECRLYEKYLSIIELQRSSITEFDTETLLNLDVQRRSLTEQMEKMHEERLKLLEKVPGSEGKKLGEILEEQASPREAKFLNPLISRLKKLVNDTRQETVELQIVQNFALSVVNGSLSLFARASKHVSRQYGPGAKINESYVPRKSRKEGVIKEA